MANNFETVSQVEDHAAAHGLILTPRERAQIAAVQKSERERLELLTPAAPQSRVDRFNAAYPRLLNAITGVGETILTLAQTLIVSFGVPLVLVLLLIVEHQRVVHGILLFEADQWLASFAAAALVLLNLVLEFQTHYIEHRAGYEQTRDVRWSLRIAARNMAYRLGFGSDKRPWAAAELSPAARYKRLLRLVTFTILSLALVGSMRVVIEQTPGAWYHALAAILTESDLLLIMTWLGGLLFAIAAVLSAQGLSRYVAIRTVEILTAMKARQAVTSDPHAAAVEQAGAAAALALINAKLEKQHAKAEQARPTQPELLTIQPIDQTPGYQASTTNGKH
jgi:hypothetical protein